MIIKSIIDGDLYKITMQQAIIKLYPTVKVRYSFINRDKTPFPEGFAEELRKEVHQMENLTLLKEEGEWLLRNCNFLDPAYLDFLNGFRFNSSEVGIIQKGTDLQISIEGYWYKTILWETTLMALISELYFKLTSQKPVSKEKRKQNNINKAQLFRMHGMQYADFGTRRRFSYEIHNELINDFKSFSLNNENFLGTSNLHFAHKYNIKPIGTHAHEWFSFHGALVGYKMANQTALENWIDIYKGDLGIALTDTFTTDKFFKSFNKKLSCIFSGIRQDSGDPIAYTTKAINHYKSMGIDPMSKMIIFSDNLNVDKAIEINNFCKGKIKCSFGIGTNFTNDVGIKPLNIVIKLIQCKINNEWINTVKLSDVLGKETGDENEIKICKNTLRIN